MARCLTHFFSIPAFRPPGSTPVQSGILKEQTGTLPRSLHVVSPTDGGSIVLMKAMLGSLAHHIGPAVRHEELRFTETCFLWNDALCDRGGDVAVCLKKGDRYLSSGKLT